MLHLQLFFRWTRAFRNRSNETVTTAGQGLNESRAFGRVSQGISQPSHCAVQTLIEFNKGIGWPHARAKLVSGHKLAGFFQEKLEDFEGLVLKLDPDALSAQFRGVRVELKDAELEHSADWAGSAHGAGSLAPLWGPRQSMVQVYVFTALLGLGTG